MNAEVRREGRCRSAAGGDFAASKGACRRELGRSMREEAFHARAALPAEPAREDWKIHRPARGMLDAFPLAARGRGAARRA